MPNGVKNPCRKLSEYRHRRIVGAGNHNYLVFESRIDRGFVLGGGQERLCEFLWPVQHHIMAA